MDRHPAILDVMVATESLFPRHVFTNADESRVLLHDVPWSTYVVLRDSVDSSGTAMTYLEGWLEIMTKSRRHEVEMDYVTRLIELWCLERDIPLYGYGQMTVRREDKQRGLEPDQWYCRGKDRKLPDIAIEIVVTNPLIDKLEVFRGLGIREVWVYKDNAFKFLVLQGDHYVAAPTSALVPEIDFARIAHYANEPDEHLALKALRDELRETP